MPSTSAISLFLIGIGLVCTGGLAEEDGELREKLVGLVTDFCNCATKLDPPDSTNRQACIDNINPYIDVYCHTHDTLGTCINNIGNKFRRDCNDRRCWSYICISQAKRLGFFPQNIAWVRPKVEPYPDR